MQIQIVTSIIGEYRFELDLFSYKNKKRQITKECLCSENLRISPEERNCTNWSSEECTFAYYFSLNTF